MIGLICRFCCLCRHFRLLRALSCLGLATTHRSLPRCLQQVPSRSCLISNATCALVAAITLLALGDLAVKWAEGLSAARDGREVPLGGRRQ